MLPSQVSIDDGIEKYFIHRLSNIRNACQTYFFLKWNLYRSLYTVVRGKLQIKSKIDPQCLLCIHWKLYQEQVCLPLLYSEMFYEFYRIFSNAQCSIQPRNQLNCKVKLYIHNLYYVFSSCTLHKPVSIHCEIQDDLVHFIEVCNILCINVSNNIVEAIYRRKGFPLKSYDLYDWSIVIEARLPFVGLKVCLHVPTLCP